MSPQNRAKKYIKNNMKTLCVYIEFIFAPGTERQDMEIGQVPSPCNMQPTQKMMVLSEKAKDDSCAHACMLRLS